MNWQIETAKSISWPELEAKQAELVQKVRQDPTRAYLLISEPSPTFTFGRFASRTDLLWTETELRAREISVHPVSRGGKWTYHGPGQILLYPIVRLDSLYPKKAVHRFLADLRLAVTELLEEKGLAPEKREKPFGIYLDGKKIASFGIAVERGVVSHGVAIYLTPQSETFRGIHPCGVAGEAMGSLHEAGVDLSWDRAAEALAVKVKKVFKHVESW